MRPFGRDGRLAGDYRRERARPQGSDSRDDLRDGQIPRWAGRSLRRLPRAALVSRRHSTGRSRMAAFSGTPVSASAVNAQSLQRPASGSARSRRFSPGPVQGITAGSSLGRVARQRVGRSGGRTPPLRAIPNVAALPHTSAVVCQDIAATNSRNGNPWPCCS